MASKSGHGDADDSGDFNNGKLLRDIEEISKALYLHKTPSKASLPPFDNRSKSAGKTRLSRAQFSSNQQFLREDLLPKYKKSSSPWNWKKPLKALTHIGHRKFNCCFNFHVHSIEGLPSNLNGVSLCVHWKRKNSILKTRPSRVFQGVAEFDETLMHTCSVYGSQSGSNHSAKYESKLFLIYASVVGVPQLDIGKHEVDLTRLLPLTLEELEGDRSSGKWTTSFRLTGKARGANLNVSFSFHVIKDDLMKLSGSVNALNLINLDQRMPSATGNDVNFSSSNTDMVLWRGGIVPNKLHDGSILPSHSEDMSTGHEVLLDYGSDSGSGLSKSIKLLYQKIDENFYDPAREDSEYVGPLDSPTLLNLEPDEESNQYEFDYPEFTIIEKGIETLEDDFLKFDGKTVQTVDMSAVETIGVDEIVKDNGISFVKNKICNSKNEIRINCMDGDILDDSKHKCNSSLIILPSIEELDSASITSDLVASNPSQPMNDSLAQEQYTNVKSNYKAHKMERRSHSLDDITESVASDFLNMLHMESSGSFGSSFDGDPQSPREQLLREFEKEAIASGNFIFDFDAKEGQLDFCCPDPLGSSSEDCPVDFNLSLIVQAAEEEHARASQSLINRRKAKILEDLETESLMLQWGLNDRDFRNSPRTCSGGFGSPIELPSEESSALPSIGPGLGSFIQTQGGGFLRSMSPSLFLSAKNGGKLIIQASNPVVLPAKMGNDIMEILLQVASAGVEELCDHIYRLMPLRDITGKSIQNMAWDGTTSTDAPERQDFVQQELFEEFGRDSDCIKNELKEFPYEVLGLDYVPLEDVAPMTIDKIEALFIEGLRIQSGMPSEEATSYIRPQYPKMFASGGRVADKGVAESQVKCSGDIDSDVDRLLGLSIPIDQWLRLDAGIIKDQNPEQNLKILKVHDSKISDYEGEGLENAMDRFRVIYGGKHGLLGDHLTVAFVTQLRDPFRNYEAVGVPMLVLTQVERVYVQAMLQDHNMVLETREKKEMEDTSDMDNGTHKFRFKMSGVHLAGVVTKPGQSQLWGTATQKQSGFRWLLASGMGSSGNVKHSSSKSNAIVRPSSLLANKLQSEDILWSISSHVHVTDTNGLAAQNAHIRNPDILFAN
ncbi:hypothetical protein L6164_024473 [Bauhinia variegata]|uniref:Uncharacterized protein n=1 Tax=Bauhinia variegata TaxID=167791 RepID=A0ACB9LXW1_BAUVA|nr:hypothetical protein L6164_024473 [Bauhinia variegata]